LHQFGASASDNTALEKQDSMEADADFRGIARGGRNQTMEKLA
jgi:hypothetical protein